MCLKPFHVLERTPTPSGSASWALNVRSIARTSLVAALVVGCLQNAPPASAKHRHKIREASGKVYSCVYRLQDADTPYSTYLIYPSPIRIDLESILAESNRSEREMNLQKSVRTSCSADFSVKLDDILELSTLYQQEDRREPLFHCIDFLLKALNDADSDFSGLSLTALRESADLTAAGVAEQQLDQSEVYIAEKDYSKAVGILNELVHLRDTKSAAAAHLDWTRAVATMKAIRPFVSDLQQGLLDWDMFKATYDPDKVIPLTPEVRELFTQNVPESDEKRPVQTLQK